MTDEEMQAISEAVAAWTARGGHLQSGLVQPQAAAEIGVTRHRLTAWLHQNGQKYSDWISALRVEEAKRVIKEHSDWSNEAIAQHRGFTDRPLLRTFKRFTGMTPLQYAER